LIGLLGHGGRLEHFGRFGVLGPINRPPDNFQILDTFINRLIG